jgi:hypothetical protein
VTRPQAGSPASQVPLDAFFPLLIRRPVIEHEIEMRTVHENRHDARETTASSPWPNTRKSLKTYCPRASAVSIRRSAERICRIGAAYSSAMIPRSWRTAATDLFVEMAAACGSINERGDLPVAHELRGFELTLTALEYKLGVDQQGVSDGRALPDVGRRHVGRELPQHGDLSLGRGKPAQGVAMLVTNRGKRPVRPDRRRAVL